MLNRIIFLSTVLVLLPSMVWACEPIVPLAMLYSGTSFWSVIATTSALGLLLAIALKSMVFKWKSGFKTSDAVIFMFLANLYSTLPGILLAVSFSSSLIIFSSFFIYLIPARNLVKHKPFDRFGVPLTAFVLAALTVATAVLFGFSIEMQSRSLPAYWMVKIFYSSIAIGISILITTACEETVISFLYEKKYKEWRSFMEPVMWANLVVFLLLVGTAAALILPKRLASPDFLIYLLKAAKVV